MVAVLFTKSFQSSLRRDSPSLSPPKRVLPIGWSDRSGAAKDRGKPPTLEAMPASNTPKPAHEPIVPLLTTVPAVAAAPLAGVAVGVCSRAGDGQGTDRAAQRNWRESITIKPNAPDVPQQ
jgi:hypothetical protein